MVCQLRECSWEDFVCICDRSGSSGIGQAIGWFDLFFTPVCSDSPSASLAAVGFICFVEKYCAMIWSHFVIRSGRLSIARDTWRCYAKGGSLFARARPCSQEEP
ncbi:hypothetical protein Y032_0531g3027 [Ancylostoma ceylanicum]|nr:hypothetical protein Y032_0531g3027 [Ancylostoma ceylanicum]